MINVIQNKDKYEISFPYDPDIVSRVKNVPGRTWIPDKKVWTIQKEKLGFFLSQIRGSIYESEVHIYSNEDINKNENLESTYTIPDIDLKGEKFRVKEGFEPYKHQIDFFKYAIDREQKGNMNGFLLADEQGLSKSAETINIALYNKKHYGFKHCLIICCVNTAKFTWKNEINIHTNGEYEGYILGTRFKRDKVTKKYDSSSLQKYEDISSMKKYGKDEEDLPYFIIINIEALRYKSKKKYPIVDRIIELVNSHEINMIAMDEVHKNISPQSMQGKQILRIKRSTDNNAEWIPMTGTPITNKPTDLFLPLRVINGHTCNSYWNWCQDFCIYGGYGGYEIVGYKNMPKLKAMLQGNMIRRLKSEVLDLPPKIQYTEYVENTEYQNKLYQDVLKDVISHKEEIVESLNPMTQLLRLRQVNGSPEIVDEELNVDTDYLKKNAKLIRLLELLEEIHERNEKVLIFSNWVEPLRTLYKFVSQKYKVCAYTGTMKSEDREKSKQKFMDDPKYTVMLGTVGAMGTTVTLTAAQNIIFYDEPWTPADKEQAEDRIHRIGTTSSVNIYSLLTINTIDERVHDILYNKKGVSNFIIDNKIDLHKDPKLFDLLLGHDKEM